MLASTCFHRTCEGLEGQSKFPAAGRSGRVDDTGAERTRRRMKADHDARLERGRIKLNLPAVAIAPLNIRRESHAMRNAQRILSAIAMAVVTLGAVAPGFTQKLLASYPTLATDAALCAAQVALAQSQKQGYMVA